jgi:hypothetical protein
MSFGDASRLGFGIKPKPIIPPIFSHANVSI